MGVRGVDRGAGQNGGQVRQLVETQVHLARQRPREPAEEVRAAAGPLVDRHAPGARRQRSRDEQTRDGLPERADVRRKILGVCGTRAQRKRECWIARKKRCRDVVQRANRRVCAHVQLEDLEQVRRRMIEVANDRTNTHGHRSVEPAARVDLAERRLRVEIVA